MRTSSAAWRLLLVALLCGFNAQAATRAKCVRTSLQWIERWSVHILSVTLYPASMDFRLRTVAARHLADKVSRAALRTTNSCIQGLNFFDRTAFKVAYCSSCRIGLSGESTLRCSCCFFQGSETCEMPLAYRRLVWLTIGFI